MAAVQPILFLGEIHRHQPGGEQRAVEPVGPRMVGAGQAGHASVRFGADHRAPVPAHVVEGIDGRLVAADDDDRFTADLEKKVVALAPYLIDVSGDDPLAHDDLAPCRPRTPRRRSRSADRGCSRCGHGRPGRAISPMAMSLLRLRWRGVAIGFCDLARSSALDAQVLRVVERAATRRSPVAGHRRPRSRSRRDRDVGTIAPPGSVT